ncbi:MAG: efflux RND transporter periplasmic adaptor subunit [Armatimonadetes bacterium]|nr:efflux RND transporter periplasmic adaptor subunit [Armatimonadota bacterium]
MPVVPLVLLLAVIGYGVWKYLEARAAADNRFIEGSGTIEATQVQIAGKMPGRVKEVLVRSGDQVKAGAVLVRFDTQEVDAQIAQASAAVEVARARVAQAEAALRAQRTQASSAIEQARAAERAAQARVPQADSAVTLTQEQWEQQLAQARAAVATAEAARAAATANRAAVRASLQRAEQDLARAVALYREGAVAAQAIDAARAAVDVLKAQEAAAAAQEAAAARQVEQARATLALVLASQRQVAIRQQDVSVAKAQEDQARAAAAGARSTRDLVAQRQQDLAAARAALAQAEATLGYTHALAANAILTSPIDGVVLSRNIEPGEVVAAGVPLLAVADLRSVWLRIFVPEDRVARLKIGQSAEVFVDAFPNRPFAGQVSEIASQAEFTPRNVQTKQERVKLVFAVRITLDNPQGLLKPGMPADARIRTEPAP